MFHFTCFNVEDPDDPAVGLLNGEVTIPGNLLRREVFDPVVSEVRSRSHGIRRRHALPPRPFSASVDRSQLEYLRHNTASFPLSRSWT